MDLMRVHVIGGPGTGKTAVAGAIAKSLDLPLVELDRVVAYRPPADGPIPPSRSWERAAARAAVDVVVSGAWKEPPGLDLSDRARDGD